LYSHNHTHNHHHSTWGSPGSATPLSLAWNNSNPSVQTLAVGRQDGIVDLLSYHKRTHRLLQLSDRPCRAVAFTPDGQLLVAGNDAGLLCVWDVHRSSRSQQQPVLVHHVLEAHHHWILRVECLSDSRRLITLGRDRRVHVWSVSQMDRPLHTFQLDTCVWTAHVLQQQPSQSSSSDGNITTAPPRLVTGSDNGWLQVFSLES